MLGLLSQWCYEEVGRSYTTSTEVGLVRADPKVLTGPRLDG